MLSRCGSSVRQRVFNNFHLAKLDISTVRSNLRPLRQYHVQIHRTIGNQSLCHSQWSRTRHFPRRIIGVCFASTDSVDEIIPKSDFSTLEPVVVSETINKTEAFSVAVDAIPEPPPIPTSEIVEAISYAGEPAFATMGLGGWSPVGIVQNCLEYLHVGLDIPWWVSIVIGTICVRVLIFPLVIIAQRNAAKMNNNLPLLQEIQLKMTEARQSGNQLEATRYAQEMMVFMKEKDVNPIKNMVVPLAQMPVFISFFMGLRGMANVPVDSMREGGILWFTDLTMPDPYFILPVITSATMWLTIEIGTDTARLSSQNLQTMKYVLRALPVCIIPFTVNFPGAILCYWVSTNFISLLQVGFLRIPAVRDYFKIEALVKHNPDKLPVKTKPFIAGIKDSWNNMKITKEMEERERIDEMRFQRAGRGPVVKTYKYDVTKTPVNAKKH